METVIAQPMYYGIALSDNIARTDEGYLICRNAVIARTGYQTYKCKELPQENLRRLGLIISPTDDVEVYRSHDEVFSDATVASFEGKPITYLHPPDFLDADTVGEFQRGHLQNVRMGAEPLASGDWPLMADVIVTHNELIQKIESEGLRELSGGYDYDLERVDGKLCQIGIRGNHVAVVPRGRAGMEARINDAAPGLITPKENKPMSKIVDKAKHIFGLGIAALVGTGASPEDVADAALAVRARAFDAAATETEEEEKEKEAKAKAAKDKAAKDAASETGTHTETEAGGRTTDADEHSKRMHGALDRMLKKKSRAAQDADVEKLKKMFSEDSDDDESAAERELREENEAGNRENEAHNERGTDAEESEHSEKCEDSACTGDCMEGQDKEAKGKGKDALDALLIQPTERRPVARAHDELAVLVLKTLKPFVARSKDRAMIKAFDAMVNTVKKSKPAEGAGDYSTFVEATQARATDAGQDPAMQARATDAGQDPESPKAIAKMNAEMAKRHRVNANEVK